jgi:hypothetical protein
MAPSTTKEPPTATPRNGSSASNEGPAGARRKRDRLLRSCYFRAELVRASRATRGARPAPARCPLVTSLRGWADAPCGVAETLKGTRARAARVPIYSRSCCGACGGPRDRSPCKHCSGFRVGDHAVAIAPAVQLLPSDQCRLSSAVAPDREPRVNLDSTRWRRRRRPRLRKSTHLRGGA